MRSIVYVIVVALIAYVVSASVIPVARAQPAAKSSGSWSSSSSKSASWNHDSTDPLAGNPEAEKLRDAEAEAAGEAEHILSQLQQASTNTARAELKPKLREALVQQFDAQQKRRSLEIANIEERLAKYKETLKKRDTAKDTIVDRRLDQLMGVGDDLGWEETQPTPKAARGAAKASRGASLNNSLPSAPPPLGSPPPLPGAEPLAPQRQ